jgi:hypothetical protein
MNVMEDTRNLVKSKAAGIGVGSRRSISNVVHWSLVLLGRLPRRANNSWDMSDRCSHTRIVKPRAPDLSVLPVKPHPFPPRRDERLLSDGKQAIEANTKCADLLFVRISFG